MTFTMLQGTLAFYQSYNHDRKHQVAERLHPGNFHFARRINNRIFVRWEITFYPVIDRHGKRIASFSSVRGCKRS